MKQPILLNIKQQFPEVIQKSGAPANCRYRVPYAVKTTWWADRFRVVEQDYDAEDRYVGLIEIKTKEKLSFIITTTLPDLFWIYQLEGAITIRQHPTGMEHNGFLDHLSEDHYALIYSPPRQYEITVEAGLHILFYFVVNAGWLQRHPIVEPTHFQKLVKYLRHKKDVHSSTKVLPIHDAIRKEILHLLSMQSFEAMKIDAELYSCIVKLILMSREDLEWNGETVSRNMRDTLAQIRSYYKQQISLGKVPPISEVAQHFKLGLQQLRREHKLIYGHSLQAYITETRMELAAEQLLRTKKSISTIAYDLGYNLHWFSAQFKIHFNLSPQDFRMKYKGNPRSRR